MIVTIISTNVVKFTFIPLCPFVETKKKKKRIKFSASWWSGNEK